MLGKAVFGQLLIQSHRKISCVLQHLYSDFFMFCSVLMLLPPHFFFFLPILTVVLGSSLSPR